MNQEDSKLLLKVAYDAIEATISNKKLKFSKEIIEKFSEKKGVFVSLKKDEELRGSIGYVFPEYNLLDQTIRAAQRACAHDPRYIEVNKKELKDLTIIISILTEPEEITGDASKQIEIGKDGLCVKFGPSIGVLLPRVGKERNPTPIEFLERTCIKAQLAPDMWRDPNVKIFKFQAEEIVKNG